MKVYVLSIVGEIQDDSFNKAVYYDRDKAIKAGEKSVKGRSDLEFLVEHFDITE